MYICQVVHIRVCREETMRNNAAVWKLAVPGRYAKNSRKQQAEFRSQKKSLMPVRFGYKIDFIKLNNQW